MPRTYTSKTFNYLQDFSKIDFRKSPHLYQIGQGEQGVLMVEPYKSEILPYWKFKTEAIATTSARQIYSLYLQYLKQNDFVGMDMCRKFLQMGYTRARRYANHPTGRKYISNPQKEPTPKREKVARKNQIPQVSDWASNEKARAARVFYGYYKKVREDLRYIKAKEAFLK